MKLFNYLFFTAIITLSGSLFAQETQIRGFVHVNSFLRDDKVSFELGEYDLFITSEINDRISFLGETVFRYDRGKKDFEVSVERVIFRYNYYGNHSFLIGKHHTPLNYWNDSYHHGRVFFPTIDRPYLFRRNIIPLHTTGASLQGMNLGKLRFGYDLMVGNGIGSGDLEDNDTYKSLTAAIHIRPMDRMRIGATFYNDRISPLAEEDHHSPQTDLEEEIRQQLYTASFAYFGKKLEVLTEATYAVNKAESTGSLNSMTSYFYAGYRFKDKIVPYFRVDCLDFEDEELYYNNSDVTSLVTGVRYEINYLAVVKLEYQHESISLSDNINTVKLQIAIGF
ncbi:hypothetical protein [Robiginitalea sp. IMCC43444]|uniref:hypothetical protein n=1 Tax=Robiginitalea sp. IMCC43444 TaxID=3459121 RepID=UPI0040421C64